MKPLWFAVLSMAMAGAGCAIGDDDSTAADPVLVAAAPPVPTTTQARVASDPPAPPASTSRTTTTDVASRPYAVPWAVPSGAFEFGGDDVLALRDDGQLVVLRGVLAGGLEEEVVAELGSIEIDDVAGIVNGALVLGSCCGSSSGLLSIPNPAAGVRRFAAGRHPSFSPTRNWLVAIGATRTNLAIHDVPSGLVTDAPYTDDVGADPLGLLWAADDSAVFVLSSADVATLTRVGAAPPFEPEASIDLERLFPRADPEALRFAGRGPDGEVAIWGKDDGAVVIRFVDPVTLVEQPGRERGLAATATAVRLGPDGGRLLWVDEGTLWYQPLFSEAGALGAGYRAGWFLG